MGTALPGSRDIFPLLGRLLLQRGRRLYLRAVLCRTALALAPVLACGSRRVKLILLPWCTLDRALKCTAASDLRDSQAMAPPPNNQLLLLDSCPSFDIQQKLQLLVGVP